jgi:predicted outer membrane protein
VIGVSLVSVAWLLSRAEAFTSQLKGTLRFRSTEPHDHGLVGDTLKSIIEANGREFLKQLSAEFQARLDKTSALPANQFDAAYIEDMKKIYAADGAAFAKEAASGTNPDLKEFAVETYRIVQRHFRELGAKVHGP